MSQSKRGTELFKKLNELNGESPFRQRRNRERKLAKLSKRMNRGQR